MKIITVILMIKINLFWIRKKWYFQLFQTLVMSTYYIVFSNLEVFKRDLIESKLKNTINYFKVADKRVLSMWNRNLNMHTTTGFNRLKQRYWYVGVITVRTICNRE